VDYRDQLISERTRVQNRLHADLQILVPGYRAKVRRLATSPQRARAAALLSAAAGIRAELAGRRLERLEELDADVAILTKRIKTAVRASGTRLVSIVGVGAITAAKLLGETGDPRRFRSMGGFAMACGAAPIPASSGQTNRHRLNRGGNRQLNRALHTIALVQARVDPRARTFVDRKQAEGKTWLESIRCLKRHLADVVYRRMVADLVETP
jgi:transposase